MEEIFTAFCTEWEKIYNPNGMHSPDLLDSITCDALNKFTRKWDSVLRVTTFNAGGVAVATKHPIRIGTSVGGVVTVVDSVYHHAREVLEKMEEERNNTEVLEKKR